MSFQSRKISAESLLNFRRGPQAAAARSTADSLLPVLVVLHQETSTPGRVGNVLRALGHRLDIRRPRFGDPLPRRWNGHAGAGHFRRPDEGERSGRFHSTGDRLDRGPAPGAAAVSGNLPGRPDARHAARRAGCAASAGRSPDRILSCPPDARRLEICPNWPDHVYHWHQEGFELPAGAELLAEGSDFPVEAFRVDHCFGFQFHPDVTYAMMHRWTTRGHARLELLGARPRHRHFADRAVHDVTERAWLKQFLDGWLARVPRSVMSEAAE